MATTATTADAASAASHRRNATDKSPDTKWLCDNYAKVGHPMQVFIVGVTGARKDGTMTGEHVISQGKKKSVTRTVKIDGQNPKDWCKGYGAGIYKRIRDKASRKTLQEIYSEKELDKSRSFDVDAELVERMVDLEISSFLLQEIALPTLPFTCYRVCRDAEDLTADIIARGTQDLTCPLDFLKHLEHHLSTSAACQPFVSATSDLENVALYFSCYGVLRVVRICVDRVLNETVIDFTIDQNLKLLSQEGRNQGRAFAQRSREVIFHPKIPKALFKQVNIEHKVLAVIPGWQNRRSLPVSLPFEAGRSSDLGGCTYALKVTINSDPYVLKRGGNGGVLGVSCLQNAARHALNEFISLQMYRMLGASVPDSCLYLVAVTVEGLAPRVVPLLLRRYYDGTSPKADDARIRKHAPVDVFMRNFDCMGADCINVLDVAGELMRIDVAASLGFAGTGIYEPANPDPFLILTSMQEAPSASDNARKRVMAVVSKRVLSSYANESVSFHEAWKVWSKHAMTLSAVSEDIHRAMGDQFDEAYTFVSRSLEIAMKPT